MTLAQIDAYPEEPEDTAPLCPPRRMRCIRRMALLMLGLAITGWLLWGLRLFGLALWLHGSALALGLSLQLFGGWYLWRK